MKRHICLRRSYPLNFYKDCLPQISLGGFEYLDSFVIGENDLGFPQCVLLPVVWSLMISLGNFHFVKIVRIPSYSCPYSVRMRENTDQNNSEYGHYLLSVFLKEVLFLSTQAYLPEY